MRLSKTFWKYCLIIIFLLLIFIPFWIYLKRDKVYKDFIKIEYEIYNAFLPNEDYEIDTIAKYCAKIENYITINEISSDILFDCDYPIDNLDIDYRAAFLSYAKDVGKYYYSEMKSAHTSFFFIFITSIILYHLLRVYIDKRYEKTTTNKKYT